jgi:glycosyltransferase 2 family protein
MTRTLRVIFQYVFFLGLGVFFAWLSVKSLDRDKFSQIGDILSDARHWILIPVLVILFLSHYVRALRWRLLIESINYKASRANTFFAVMIGYMTNQVLPRFGEVLKCSILGRYEKIPMDTLIGTIILERLVDAITLLLIFTITLLLEPGIYNQLHAAIFDVKQENPEPSVVPGWVVTLVIAGFLLFLLFSWMIRKKKKLSDIPPLLLTVWQHIVKGVSAIGSLKRRWYFIFLTIALWALYLFAGYLGFVAMKETQQYGIKEAFAILSAGSIGMVVSPGGVGAYAYLVQQTMESYGLTPVIAFAFGWVLWVVQTSVNILGGLFSFVAIPYYNKKKLSEPF